MEIALASVPMMPVTAASGPLGLLSGTAQFAALLGDVLAAEAAGEMTKLAQPSLPNHEPAPNLAARHPAAETLDAAAQPERGSGLPNVGGELVLRPHEHGVAPHVTGPDLESPGTANSEPRAEVLSGETPSAPPKPLTQQRTSRLQRQDSEVEMLQLAEQKGQAPPELVSQILPPPGASEVLTVIGPQPDGMCLPSQTSRPPEDGHLEASPATSSVDGAFATAPGPRSAVAAHPPPPTTEEATPSIELTAAAPLDSAGQSAPETALTPSPIRDVTTAGRLDQMVRSPTIQVSRQVEVLLPAAQHDQPAAAQIIIRLNPPELGGVRIRVERPKEGGATVTLTVERPETLILMLRDREGLSQALDRAGVPADGRVITYQAASLATPADTRQADLTQGEMASRWSGQGGSFASGQQRDGQNGSTAAQQPGGPSQPDAPLEPQRIILRDRVDITA